MTARLPTHSELTNLYSRAEVRACLGWSDDKLRRRLAKLSEIRPSGSCRSLKNARRTEVTSLLASFCLETQNSAEKRA